LEQPPCRGRQPAGDEFAAEKEAWPDRCRWSISTRPYGIKYGSNFQPFVNKRDVKDGKDEDLKPNRKWSKHSATLGIGKSTLI